MPAIPIGRISKLVVQYGPAVRDAYKALPKVSPEQRTRAVDILRAADPKKRLRNRLEDLVGTLETQIDSDIEPERRERLSQWLNHARGLLGKLSLADGLPGKARATSYRSVAQELEGLIRDLVSHEVGGNSPAAQTAGGRRNRLRRHS